jgi:hypothetical protein
VLNQIPAPTTRFTDANSVVEARSFNYSTDEINTGAKWIDGKPIFRRVVHCINWLAHADLNQILNVMDTPIKALGVKHDPASTWNRVTIENIVITTSGEPSARDLSPPFHAIIEYTKL